MSGDDQLKLPQHAIDDWQAFLDCHQTIAPGDHYRIDFPISIATFREFGAPFLTEAFRASGVITNVNSVVEIVELVPVDVLGASERALLTVDYAIDEPGLHRKLFMKFPSADVRQKFELARMADGEVAMQRLSSQRWLPVATAKYYFGDHSARTTNFILITECIPFGVPPVEPAHRKGFDHLIPDVKGHYELLARSLGKLVAAHKSGKLGEDIDNVFPPGRAARDFHPIVDAEARIDRLVEFVSNTAPHLFIPEVRDPAFLDAWRHDLKFGLDNKDALLNYLISHPDYMGLCHPNLNVDNAWYWRDPCGELRIGLLDWGGAGHMSIAQALSGMMMMPEPEKYSELLDLVMTSFLSEYTAGCGIELDHEELRLQFKASLFSTAICTIVGMIVDYLPMYSPDDWASMQSRFDERLQASGMIATVVWIDIMLREWRDTVTPGDACRQIVAGSAASTPTKSPNLVKG